MREGEPWLRAGCADGGAKPSALDTAVAYSARVNNYWRGGAAVRRAGVTAVDREAS